MKIGGGPKLPAVPATLDEAAKTAAKSVRNLPSVAKTPAPGGSVPTPYPNAGDTFERVDRSRVGNLLQAQADIHQMEEKIQKERDAAWTSFGHSIVAAAVASGMAGAGAASGASAAALGAAGASLLAAGAGAAAAAGDGAAGAEAVAKGAGPGAAPAGAAADGAAGAAAGAGAGAGAAAAGAAAAGAAATGAAGAGAVAGGAVAAGAAGAGGAAAGAAAAGAGAVGTTGAGAAAGGGAAAGAAGAAAASSDVVSALLAGAAAGAAAAAGGAAASSGAAAAAQGALQVVTEAAVRGGAQAVNELASSWSRFVNEMPSGGGAVDPNALVQSVLRESYLQTTEDLRFYAEKVKHFNEQKGAIREHLQKLRDHDMSAEAAAGGSAGETGKSQPQETLRLFQETVNQASNIHRKFSETAQAIIANLKA